LGCVARIPDHRSISSGSIRQVIVCGVAASVQGSEQPGRVFPVGVTLVPASHMAFVLATAKLDSTEGGMRRFGVTEDNVLTIFGRAIALPSGCLTKPWWDRICTLRNAIRREIAATHRWGPAAKGPSAGAAPPVLADVMDVSEGVWQLLTLAADFDGQEATASASDPNWAATIPAEGQGQGPTGMQALASWEEVKSRKVTAAVPAATTISSAAPLQQSWCPRPGLAPRGRGWAPRAQLASAGWAARPVAALRQQPNGVGDARARGPMVGLGRQTVVRPGLRPSLSASANALADFTTKIEHYQQEDLQDDRPGEESEKMMQDRDGESEFAAKMEMEEPSVDEVQEDILDHGPEDYPQAEEFPDGW